MKTSVEVHGYRSSNDVVMATRTADGRTVELFLSPVNALLIASQLQAEAAYVVGENTAAVHGIPEAEVLTR